MNKFFTLLLMALIASISLSSCLSEGDDDENTYTTVDYYTITGSLTSGYTLYGDNGGVVIPNSSSVVSLAGSNGFGSHHRALLYIQYTQDMVGSDQNTLNGGTVVSGSYLDERSILTPEEATVQGITAEDSLFQVASFTSLWGRLGYLNTAITGVYSYVNGLSIQPTAQLVVDTASIADNDVTLDLYYNRHTSSDALTGGSTATYTSFYLDNLGSMVPGSADTITVSVRCEGCDTRSIRIPRTSMHHVQ